MSVAVTKLGVPAARAGVIARPRVDVVLDRAAAGPVTIVCAPAGYGKTIAVASWLRSRGLDAAWVSLDETDDDPAALLSSITAGLQRA